MKPPRSSSAARSSSGSRSRNRNRRLQSSNGTAVSVMTRCLMAHAHLNLTGLLLQESRDPSGSGDFCDVYRGLSVAHGKCVAIKRFRGHAIGEQVNKYKRYLARELEVWAKLHHPNILPLLGYTVDVGIYPALVSEWMPNGTVLQYCSKTLGVDVLNLVRGFAGGLFYLHSKGVVHSDVKSDNILVDSSGTPRLADFGVSKLFIQSGTVDSTSDIKGTIRWMPIEFLQSEACNTYQGRECKLSPSLQADVWSFGMTVYEFLSKGRPYAQIPSDVQVIFAIVRGELPTAPCVIESGGAKAYELQLWEICKRCWANAPEERPAMVDITYELSCRSGASDGNHTCNKSLPDADVRSDSCLTGTESLADGLGPLPSSIAQDDEKLFIKLSPETYKQRTITNKDTSLLSQIMKQSEDYTYQAITHLTVRRHAESLTIQTASQIGESTGPQSHRKEICEKQNSHSNAANTHVRRLKRSEYWKEHYHGAGW